MTSNEDRSLLSQYKSCHYTKGTILYNLGTNMYFQGVLMTAVPTTAYTYTYRKVISEKFFGEPKWFYSFLNGSSFILKSESHSANKNPCKII